MGINKERVVKVIFSAVDQVNLQLSRENQLSKAIDTAIFGAGAKLDSLGFINFIVALEQKIEDEFQETILMDNIEISRKNNPFRSIGALANHISLRLKEK